MTGGLHGPRRIRQIGIPCVALVVIAALVSVPAHAAPTAQQMLAATNSGQRYMITVNARASGMDMHVDWTVVGKAYDIVADVSKMKLEYVGNGLKACSNVLGVATPASPTDPMLKAFQGLTPAALLPTLSSARFASIGTKTIAGQRAAGYRISNIGTANTGDVWVDPRTSRLIALNVASGSLGAVKLTISHWNDAHLKVPAPKC